MPTNVYDQYQAADFSDVPIYQPDWELVESVLEKKQQFYDDATKITDMPINAFSDPDREYAAQLQAERQAKVDEVTNTYIKQGTAAGDRAMKELARSIQTSYTDVNSDVYKLNESAINQIQQEALINQWEGPADPYKNMLMQELREHTTFTINEETGEKVFNRYSNIAPTKYLNRTQVALEYAKSLTPEKLAEYGMVKSDKAGYYEDKITKTILTPAQIVERLGPLLVGDRDLMASEKFIFALETSRWNGITEDNYKESIKEFNNTIDEQIFEIQGMTEDEVIENFPEAVAEGFSLDDVKNTAIEKLKLSKYSGVYINHDDFITEGATKSLQNNTLDPVSKVLQTNIKDVQRYRLNNTEKTNSNKSTKTKVEELLQQPILPTSQDITTGTFTADMLNLSTGEVDNINYNLKTWGNIHIDADKGKVTHTNNRGEENELKTYYDYHTLSNDITQGIQKETDTALSIFQEDLKNIIGTNLELQEGKEDPFSDIFIYEDDDLDGFKESLKYDDSSLMLSVIKDAYDLATISEEQEKKIIEKQKAIGDYVRERTELFNQHSKFRNYIRILDEQRKESLSNENFQIANQAAIEIIDNINNTTLIGTQNNSGLFNPKMNISTANNDELEKLENRISHLYKYVEAGLTSNWDGDFRNMTYDPIYVRENEENRFFNEILGYTIPTTGNPNSKYLNKDHFENLELYKKGDIPDELIGEAGLPATKEASVDPTRQGHKVADSIEGALAVNLKMLIDSGILVLPGDDITEADAIQQTIENMEYAQMSGDTVDNLNNTDPEFKTNFVNDLVTHSKNRAENKIAKNLAFQMNDPTYTNVTSISLDKISKDSKDATYEKTAKQTVHNQYLTYISGGNFDNITNMDNGLNFNDKEQKQILEQMKTVNKDNSLFHIVYDHRGNEPGLYLMYTPMIKKDDGEKLLSLRIHDDIPNNKREKPIRLRMPITDKNIGTWQAYTGIDLNQYSKTGNLTKIEEAMDNEGFFEHDGGHYSLVATKSVKSNWDYNNKKITNPDEPSQLTFNYDVTINDGSKVPRKITTINSNIELERFVRELDKVETAYKILRLTDPLGTKEGAQKQILESNLIKSFFNEASSKEALIKIMNSMDKNLVTEVSEYFIPSNIEFADWKEALASSESGMWEADYAIDPDTKKKFIDQYDTVNLDDGDAWGKYQIRWPGYKDELVEYYSDDPNAFVNTDFINRLAERGISQSDITNLKNTLKDPNISQDQKREAIKPFFRADHVYQEAFMQKLYAQHLIEADNIIENLNMRSVNAKQIAHFIHFLGGDDTKTFLEKYRDEGPESAEFWFEQKMLEKGTKNATVKAYTKKMMNTLSGI